MHVLTNFVLKSILTVRSLYSMTRAKTATVIKLRKSDTHQTKLADGWSSSSTRGCFTLAQEELYTE